MSSTRMMRMFGGGVPEACKLSPGRSRISKMRRLRMLGGFCYLGSQTRSAQGGVSFAAFGISRVDPLVTI